MLLPLVLLPPLLPPLLLMCHCQLAVPAALHTLLAKLLCFSVYVRPSVRNQTVLSTVALALCFSDYSEGRVVLDSPSAY